MSNRIIKHSSRYSGPAGDSRPADEIFDGMERRSKRSQEAVDKLLVCLDDTLQAMTLTSKDGAVEAIKDTFIEWWLKHDIAARERLEADND